MSHERGVVLSQTRTRCTDSVNTRRLLHLRLKIPDKDALYLCLNEVCWKTTDSTQPFLNAYIHSTQKQILLIVAWLGCLTFAVQSFKLEGCFHIHLLGGEKVSLHSSLTFFFFGGGGGKKPQHNHTQIIIPSEYFLYVSKHVWRGCLKIYFGLTGGRLSENGQTHSWFWPPHGIHWLKKKKNTEYFQPYTLSPFYMKLYSTSFISYYHNNRINSLDITFFETCSMQTENK